MTLITSKALNVWWRRLPYGEAYNENLKDEVGLKSCSVQPWPTMLLRIRQETIKHRFKCLLAKLGNLISRIDGVLYQPTRQQTSEDEPWPLCLASFSKAAARLLLNVSRYEMLTELWDLQAVVCKRARLCIVSLFIFYSTRRAGGTRQRDALWFEASSNGNVRYQVGNHSGNHREREKKIQSRQTFRKTGK